MQTKIIKMDFKINMVIGLNILLEIIIFFMEFIKKKYLYNINKKNLKI